LKIKSFSYKTNELYQLAYALANAIMLDCRGIFMDFNEENSEEAGEHFTPRDVVELMANLMFYPIADKITSGTYLVYDGACGTGGMLTIAEEKLHQLAKEHNKE
jgi:type I restriction-modification system DNA methylase subunit